ncbi:hypothetical protein I3760_11G204900 [Carya illinoinensis]|nr:hypothetical protein I3760_11G204900 [Carya illinoinensis]KAG2682756.1 hypothetical protein I3760_11G204900 [Carya illinoinensis]KAG2682758.1 hypothetical protein I3760_11G204900 [Carya illinoinensis]
MLSIENSPSDPSCTCDVSQLKSGSDERASHKLPLPEVDLSKRALFGETPLPKFSIRDYVFITRSKDIKTNWPFSLKNLQLCLKHGVKDVLPPFQHLDKVRNECFQESTVGSSTLENKNLKNIVGELSGPPNDYTVLDLSVNAQLNQKPPEAFIETTTSRRSEGENDLPSTRSFSQSDIESLPANGLSSSSLDPDTLHEDSVDVEAEGLAPAHQIESTTRPSNKKCRLVVKSGANSDRNLTEDIASNCTTVSELAMASKLCPVCKIFSSSSNTTLNAHIDQCLSMESVPKWMAAKLTKHRFKPRKTRLMVDIYKTAARCTLEDLDRRNGTNWATVSSLTMRDNDKSEMPAEGKMQRMLLVHTPDSGNVGAVYIDSSGTKLRILSKFDDAPSVSQVSEELGTRKRSKGGKGSKLLPAKKKKSLAPKHHKYLKLALQSKKKFSRRAHSSQIYGGQRVEERCKKNEHQAKNQVKPSDSGNLRHWVCSKRTGVAKEVSRKDAHQPLSESDQFCFGDSLVERSRVSKLANLSQNPIFSPEKSERMKSPFPEGQASDKRQRSPGRKQVGSPLFGARSSSSVERSLSLMKRNVNQLSKDSNSVCDDSILNSPKSTVDYVPLLRSKLDDIAAGPNYNSDIPFLPCTSLTRSYHPLKPKTMKFSPSRKNVSAVKGRLSVTKSRPDMIQKCSALKTCQVHFAAGIGKEVAAWYPEADEQHDLMHSHIDNSSGREEISSEVSFGSNTVLRIKQDRGAISITRKLKSSQLATQCCGHDKCENEDSSVRVRDHFLDKVVDLKSATKEVWIPGEDIVSELAAKEAVQKFDTTLFQSLAPELQHKLGSFTKTPSNSVQFIDGNHGPLCGAEALKSATKPNLVDEQDIYCADKVGNDFIGQNVLIGEEMDSEIGQENFFEEVDPIPIPGPPGSFLPSPRGMGSEDLQGNSSLTTTSRVQSSQDLHAIDGDSSDSPISATSTISNSTVAGYDWKYSKPFSSVGPQSIQDKMRSVFSVASIEPSAESVAVVPQIKGREVEKLIFDGENSNVNKISIEKFSLSFKGDEPCCCQRKERASHSAALTYQESQLLKRRAAASVTMPTIGKQMSCNLNTRPGNFDARPEIIPLSSCPSSKSEKVVSPIIKCPAGPISLKGSPDVGAKFPGHGSCDSASPAASNPVLRLMGKNLMVVNKDEDASVPVGSVQSNLGQLNPLTPRFPTLSEVSPVNIQNEVYRCHHHMVPHIGQDSHNLSGHCFEGKFSNSFRSHNTKTPQMVARGLAGFFPDQPQDGGFISFMESHEHESHFNVPSQQSKSKNRPNGSPTCNMEKSLTIPDCQQMSARSAANADREIIIIDDISSSEANLTTDVTKYSGVLRERKAVSSGIPIPAVSRHLNTFAYYQSQDPTPLGELPAVHKASFHVTPSLGAHASSARWSCTSEGSGVLQWSPFFPASPSTGHLRSALYNSPSLT